MMKLIEGEKSLKENTILYNIIFKELEKILDEEIIKQYEK
jgi:hypothetical protein